MVNRCPCCGLPVSASEPEFHTSPILQRLYAEFVKDRMLTARELESRIYGKNLRKPNSIRVHIHRANLVLREHGLIIRGRCGVGGYKLENLNVADQKPAGV